MIKLKSFFLGLGCALLLGCSTLAFAQLIEFDKPAQITPADIYFNATTTVANTLSEIELIKEKDAYNNNQAVLERLDRIYKVLNERLK